MVFADDSDEYDYDHDAGDGDYDAGEEEHEDPDHAGPAAPPVAIDTAAIYARAMAELIRDVDPVGAGAIIAARRLAMANLDAAVSTMAAALAAAFGDPVYTFGGYRSMAPTDHGRPRHEGRAEVAASRALQYCAAGVPVDAGIYFTPSPPATVTVTVDGRGRLIAAGDAPGGPGAADFVLVVRDLGYADLNEWFLAEDGAEGVVAAVHGVRDEIIGGIRAEEQARLEEQLDELF